MNLRESYKILLLLQARAYGGGRPDVLKRPKLRARKLGEDRMRLAVRALVGVIEIVCKYSMQEQHSAAQRLAVVSLS